MKKFYSKIYTNRRKHPVRAGGEQVSIDVFKRVDGDAKRVITIACYDDIITVAYDSGHVEVINED